jgi:phosphatidylethanolamine/phosphatidyl-N-methylethanolamine N-methyltransferase
MLKKAREKIATGRYPFVKDVMMMDAHEMAFADATFDCVVAQFVITLVANPERVLSECHRVVKPGGRIILVNHLYSEKGVAAAVERWAAKKTRKLGLRPGPRPTAARRWWNAARSSLSASTRWSASSARGRPRLRCNVTGASPDAGICCACKPLGE